MPKTLIWALVSSLSLCGSGYSQAWQEPDRAIEIFQNAVQAVQSFDASVTATMHIMIGSEKVGKQSKARKLRPGEQPQIRREFSRQVYYQGKGRIEILESPGGKSKHILAYDLEVGKSRQVGENAAQISRSIRTNTMDGGDYRDTYRTVFGGTPFGDLVRCFRERKGYVVVKGPTAESPLLTLQANPVTESKLEVTIGRTGFRVGLDPKRGMMPAVIELLESIDGKLEVSRRMTVNEWKDVGNGVWVPVKATIQVLCLGKVKLECGDIATETVLVVDAARSSWNRQVGEEALRLPLPAGTTVLDSERGVRYVTGRPDPGKNLDDLAKHARNVIPVASPPPPQKGSWVTWLIYGTVSVGAVVVLGLVATFVRKRRLRETP